MSPHDVLAKHDLYDLVKDVIIPLFSSLLSFIAILVAIKALRDNTKIARANYEFQITQSDRDTWRHITTQKLRRIKDPAANPNRITEEEKVNTNFIVLNVKTIFEAMELGIISSITRKELLMKDVGEFFSLPIPNRVWNKVKSYHSPEFQNFMNQCIHSHEK
jgi:hypothetical protein